MYKVNDHFPVVRCLCGREMILIKARVCECGTTVRFRRVPGKRGRYQPLAVTQDKYNLANSPLKRPEAIGWMPA